MTKLSRQLFVSVFIALSLTLTFAVFAQEAPAPQADVPSSAAASHADDEDLRRLDTAESKVETELAAPAGEEAATSADAEEKTPEEDDSAQEEIRITRKHHRQYRSASDFPMGNHTVPAGQTMSEAVSFGGSTVVEGRVEGEAVAIFGDTKVNGSTGAEAVAILGDVHVNGAVGGEVVAVLGNVELGPKAVVDGGVVVIGGRLIRDPGAVVHGNVQEITLFGSSDRFVGLKTWFYECLLWGRPLAFARHLGWAWMIAIAVFSLYVLLALLFPRAFEKCVDTLEQRPGYSLLAVVLTVLITPVLILLLVFTGVGILLLPFLVAGLFFAGIFGKAVMHAWLGRRITKYFGPGPLAHVAMATLIGGVIVLLLYTVPFLGFFLWKVLDVIGLGVVVYTLLLGMRREKAVAAPGVATPPVIAVSPAGETPVAGSTVPPVGVALATLPRVGFWLRLAASGIDAIIIGVVLGVINSGEMFLLVYAAYCVCMWATKGTTVGGIVCGLKVVRLDDRKVDWAVAVVRGLSGFLSLAVAGLGFIWVAFDDQKQSWHDKIAGTTIVRLPKGVSLL